MCHSDERSEEESSTNIQYPVASELVELVEVVEVKLVLILPFSFPPFLLSSVLQYSNTICVILMSEAKKNLRRTSSIQ
jgi:hypothetical protein